MPAFDGFPPATFRFLRELAAHNDRDWFAAHRDDYQAGYVEPALRFVEALGPRLSKVSKSLQFDARINGSLFRIQRDVRFSKDKSPYKTHLDLWFWSGERRGWDSPGCFFRMDASRLILGAGMHRFDKDRLARYRDAVVDARRGRALDKIIEPLRAKYEIGGTARKTVPRGFAPDHERAPLLLHEGLHATLDAPLPKEAHTPQFVDYCLEHFRAVWPIAEWLRKSTTGNGKGKGKREKGKGKS